MVCFAVKWVNHIDYDRGKYSNSVASETLAATLRINRIVSSSTKPGF